MENKETTILESVLKMDHKERLPYLFGILTAKSLEASKFGLNRKIIKDINCYVILIRSLIKAVPKDQILESDIKVFLNFAQEAGKVEYMRDIIDCIQSDFNEKLKG